MTGYQIDDIDRLKRINHALMNRVERAMDQQQNAFSLFQTAIALEGQVRQRTDELTVTLRNLEKTNSELARQKEISENANLSKTRFLAAASHDVLQPLHAAQLTISALSEMQESARGRALVDQVERSLDTMNELLHTILDISRLDAGVMVPAFGAVKLAPVVESLLSDFRPIAQAKGLKIRTVVSDDYVISDRAMLRRCLQNLISNAIRYTARGGVLIGTRKAGDMIRIEVIDTGRGIPEDQYERIFEEFHRGGLGKGDVEQTGLGLGLAIVKRIATALGHELTLNSVVGRGSRFSVSAYRAVGTTEAPDTGAQTGPAVPDGGFAGKRILLVENDWEVTKAMSVLMNSWGCAYKTAATLREAVETIDPDSWVPDLIIADQHLDQDDLGTLAIEAVRATADRNIPAIVATADSAADVAAASAEIGAELMSKPIKPAHLRALISHMLATTNR